MKKITTLLGALMIGVAAFAQPSAKDIIIKGNIGFNTLSQSNKYSNAYTDGSVRETGALNTFTINPQAEYFITDRSSVGISAGYNNIWMGDKAKLIGSDQWNKSKSGFSEYSVGATYNYYFPLAKRLTLSLNCFAGYVGLNSWYIYKDNDGDANERGSDNRYNLFSLSVTPTFTYFISEHWLLTASIGNLGLMAGSPSKDEDLGYVDTSEGKTSVFYAGGNWGQVMLGVGFKF